MLQNEPNAALRVIPIFVTDSLGNGVGGIVWAAGDFKLHKHEGAWVNSTNLPVEDTAGPAGSYLVSLTVAELDTLGPMFYSAIKAGIKTLVSAVMVEPATRSFNLNEATAALRTLPLFIVDGAGNGVGSIAWAAGDTKKIRSGDFAWSFLTNLPVEVTGGAVGCHTLLLETADLSVEGVLRYSVSHAGIATLVDAITVTPMDVGGILYRMRAYDTSLARHVYWNYDSIDSLGAGYAGPGPIIDVVVQMVMGLPVLLVVPGTGFEAMPEQWVKLNVPASQATTPMSAQVSTNFDELQMLRAGSIVGLSTRLTEAITAGTLTVSVTINGAPALTIVHTTGSDGEVATQNTGIDTYVAGDLVGISYSTDGFFLPITTDLEAWLQVVETP